MVEDAATPSNPKVLPGVLGGALGTRLHAVPSQCSVIPPLLTAHTSAAETSATPKVAPTKPTRGKEPPKDQAEEDDYTSRLLAAKRRAKKADEEEGESDGDGDHV